MADTSTKTTVQGGALLDALSRLLFKGIDKIFDGAAEYQKEYGVLKQVTKIPVTDKAGDEYNVIVKLAPIKDKEGLYYVEVECPDFEGFDAADDTVNKHVVQLNKSDKSKSDFEDLVDQIIKKNGLKRVKQREDGKAKADSVVKEFQFYDKETDETCKVKIAVNVLDNKIHVLAEGNPALAVPFEKTSTLDDTSKLGSDLENHLDKKCNLSIEAADQDRWDNLVDMLNNIPEWGNEIVENIEELAASSKLKVTLEKITANGHEDINLISISCADKIHIIRDIVASDEFVDSMPEGESSYEIIEEDDDYDITQI